VVSLGSVVLLLLWLGEQEERTGERGRYLVVPGYDGKEGGGHN